MNNGTEAETPDWPESIGKPSLPAGYEWVCLKQNIVFDAANESRTWWVRVSWTMQSGKTRMLKINEYFTTPYAAIEYARSLAERHATLREASDNIKAIARKPGS